MPNFMMHSMYIVPKDAGVKVMKDPDPTVGPGTDHIFCSKLRIPSNQCRLKLTCINQTQHYRSIIYFRSQQLILLCYPHLFMIAS